MEDRRCHTCKTALRSMDFSPFKQYSNAHFETFRHTEESAPVLISLFDSGRVPSIDAGTRCAWWWAPSGLWTASGGVLHRSLKSGDSPEGSLDRRRVLFMLEDAAITRRPPALHLRRDISHHSRHKSQISPWEALKMGATAAGSCGGGLAWI